ncbi:MAG: SDR family NAD(P)-dependent oxidoreductase [bacterium]|nr:SDR family NAD(P)-dependent oxidoreductase [bacterium]
MEHPHPRRDTTMTLAGQIALVTGGTDGIGKETALRLARLGAQVIIVGRNPQKGEKAVADIVSDSPTHAITYHQADLSLMSQVATLAKWVQATYPPINLLIHSAGVMLPRKTMTAEGLETVFAVQYFARYWLTMNLLNHLAPQARVINVSAGGTIPLRLNIDNINSDKFYHGVYTLMHESVANDVMMLRFMRVYPHIQFYGYGPFYVKSGLFVDMPFTFKLATNTIGRLMATTPARASEDVIKLATGTYDAGLYSRNLKRIRPNKHRNDETRQEALHIATEGHIGRALNRA